MQIGDIVILNKSYLLSDDNIILAYNFIEKFDYSDDIIDDNLLENDEFLKREFLVEEVNKTTKTPTNYVKLRERNNSSYCFFCIQTRYILPAPIKPRHKLTNMFLNK